MVSTPAMVARPPRGRSTPLRARVLSVAADWTGGVAGGDPVPVSPDAPPSADPRPENPPDADPDGPAYEAPRRSRFGRATIAVVVLSMLAMWGYVLYLAFGPGRQPPIDRLDDPAFAEAGELLCAAAVADVDELPNAGASATADERATVVDQADAVYATMLDDLAVQARTQVPAGDERDRAEAWIGDWRVYLDDRAAYAEALREDPDARMLVSEKPGEGRQITGWIDEFALANRMPSCATPTDVG